jgi:acetyltransferase-like isoleucine patch superfamily enzyme
VATVAAWSADLVAESALIRLWDAAVGERDGVTLRVLVRPGDDTGALLAHLSALPADVEVVEVADPVAGARAIGGSVALLAARAEAHAYGLPLVGPATDPARLRRELGLTPRSQAPGPDREIADRVAAGDVDGLLAAAARLAAAGALEGAAGLALAALDLAPDRADALRTLGDIRSAQDRHQDAARLYRRALAAAPEPLDLQRRRIADLQALWDCPRLEGMPDLRQPAIILGPGRVTIGDGVIFGWHRSPGFHTGSIYVEAGRPESVVAIGDGTLFNNDAVIRSEGPGIEVGRDGLFGTGVQIFDSDFHHLDPALRRSGTHPTAAVRIGDDVWVGASAFVLKGVTIGDGAVVAAAAVVTRDVPPGVLVGGNPARVIREL